MVGRRVDKGAANWEPGTDSFGRKQPAAIDAERSLLGAILSDSNTMVNVVDILEPEDFYVPKNADIYRIMKQLWMNREPIDLTTVREAAKGTPVENISLSDMVASQHVAAHIEAYAKRIKDASNRRVLIEAAGQIQVAAFEEQDSDVVAEKATSLLLGALDKSTNDDRVLTPSQQANLLVDMYNAMAAGEEPALSTGFTLLDTVTWGGFRPGELIVVAGRTSTGKSSYAENIAENVAKRGESVLYFNLEMSPKKMMQRFVKRQARLSIAALQYGPTDERDVAALYELAEQRLRMPLYLVNDAGTTSASIHAKIAKHVMKEGPLSLVVIDYLQLLRDKDAKSGSEPLRIAKITSTLHSIAREFDVPIILISQLNRNVEYRGGEPELHDLAHSGSIENDADIVLLLWDEDDEGETKKLKIAKNRDGEQQEIPIHFDGASFRFMDRFAPQTQESDGILDGS